MRNLQKFLQSQKALTIGTVGEKGNPWNTNVYYSATNDLELFFVSPLDTNHIKHIQQHQQVSFSVVWFDEQDLSNRKGVQGTGVCTQLKNPDEIKQYLKNHYQYFPGWKDSINLKGITQDLIDSRPFIIQPNYLKFWNDALYGEKDGDPIKEFTF